MRGGGVKEVAKDLCNVLLAELKRDQHLGEKVAKNKNASYKYLLDIQNACGTFKYINKNSSLKSIITACSELGGALGKPYLYRSKLSKTSFVSVPGVQDYLEKQYNIFNGSISNMEKIKKELNM